MHLVGLTRTLRGYALEISEPTDLKPFPRVRSFRISAEAVLAAHLGSPLVFIELTPQLRQLSVTGNKYSALRRNPFFFFISADDLPHLITRHYPKCTNVVARIAVALSAYDTSW